LDDDPIPIAEVKAREAKSTNPDRPFWLERNREFFPIDEQFGPFT